MRNSRSGGDSRLKNKHIRMIIDISMALILPMLMAYSLIGELFHEVAGTVIFILFIIHNILNRKWYGALFKGKYDATRIFRTVINFMVLVVMILQPISGILMSKHLYTFLPEISIMMQVRSIHMILAYWGYVLICIHAGTHLTVPMSKLAAKSKRISIAARVILGCVSVYGCIAFIRRGFPGYMLGKTAFAFFDYSEPRIFFFLDYLSVMVLFMMTGCLVIYGLGRTKRKL